MADNNVGFPLLFLIFILISPSNHCAVSVSAPAYGGSADLVRSSCTNASFPSLCFRTLSSYAGAARTPRELAQAAVSVSLARAKRASDFLATLKTAVGTGRERGALNDCVAQISDSMEELRKTMGELKALRRSTFRWQMSNAQTWVSAALTNEDTCLDGFKEIQGAANVRVDVRRHITGVARVTSNALYLINRLDQTTHP